MQFNDRVMITAPRERVWAFFTDPHAVGACAPGLESLDVLIPDEKFEIKGSVGFGAVQIHFVAQVEWLELNEPERAKMKAHGTAPGSAMDALASLELREISEGETELLWSADVTVSGTIASLASRMMSSVTKKLAAAFFACAKRELEV
ncbi:MAG: carbon monoxide dehydrogenase [Anaerolineales bacterium]|nr:MAG: carbon monoxide dehydrogenase [Anaerolineales bacterium]